MVNKIISLLGVVGLLSTLIVPTAFADDTNLDVYGAFHILEEGTASTTVDVVKLDGDALTALFVETAGGENIRNLMTVEGFDCLDTATSCTVEWDGKNNSGVYVDEGAYNVYLYLNAEGTATDFDPITVTKDTWIESFDVTPLNWDPASDTNLEVSYVLSTDDSVQVDIVDFNGTDDVNDDFAIKTLSGITLDSAGSVLWDGENSDDELMLFDGVDYGVILSAGGESKDVVEVKVNYMDSLAPAIENYDPTPTVDGSAAYSFKADDDEVEVSFDISHSAKAVVEIVDSNGKVVYSPEDHGAEDDLDEVSDVSFDWNGAEPIPVPSGLYTVEVTIVNESGAIFDDSLVLDVDSSGVTDYNYTTSKIKSIDLDPSGDWDPLEDELRIEWETTVDEFDSFTIEAWKGSEKVEIFDESDLEEDDRHRLDFEGLDDDGDYLETGEWTLYFIGEVDDVIYYNTDTFTVDYEKPSIDKTYVTKDEIDPEEGEGVYFLFMLEDDAQITVEVYEGTKSEVELIEEDDDQIVEKDKWYAVYWDGLAEDGDDLDYDDSFKFVLTACSVGSDNDSDCDEDSEKIDLDEDTASSTRSNITQDITIPAIIEQGDDLELTFNIEDAADVSVGIWKGTSTSGNADIVLLDEVALSAGDYKFVWDGRDEDGDKVKDDEYIYKITTKKSGSSNEETEKGTFRVGDLGEVLSGPSSVSVDEDEDDDDTDLSDNPYLVIDDDDDVTGSSEFPDVLPTNKNYKAIVWAAEQEIFEGNDNGTFLPYDEINRAEVLAVVLRAFDLPFYAADGSNLGWTDVNASAWYMGYLKSGKMAGLLEGDAGSTTVRPGDGVSRVELLKFIYESAKLKGVAGVGSCSFNPYADVKVGSWYTNYVCQSKTDGLFDTVGDVFFPSVEASRGEVAEALYRLLK
jgi:flagellar hook assembly protein FlgD